MNANSTQKQRNNNRAKKHPSNNKNGGGEEEKMQKILDQAKGEEGEGEMPCYIDMLPQKILNRLFRCYLDPVDRLRSEPVSKRWLSTLREEETWKGVRKIDFATVTRGHPEIQRSQITDKHLIYLFSLIKKNLNKLDIDSFVESDDIQKEVSPDNKITEELLKWLYLVPDLSVLILPPIQIRDYSFRRIARHLTNLKTLKYVFASNVTKIGLYSSTSGLQNLLLANSKLETLNFDGFPLDSFRFLPPTLKEFKMGTIEVDLPGALKTLAARCPTLETLDLMWSIHPVIDHEVNVSTLNEAFVQFKKLQSLLLVTTKDFKFHWDAEFTALGELGKLRQIILGSSGLLTDVTLRAIARGCPELEILIIEPADGNFGEFSDEALGSLSALHNLICLVFNDQRAFRALTDDTLTRIVKANRRLNTLNVTACTKLTDASILAVLQNCMSMMKLVVSGCPGVTKKSLETVVRFVRFLSEYDVPFSPIAEHRPFCFVCGDKSGIPLEEAKKAAAELHPWLHIGDDDNY